VLILSIKAAPQILPKKNWEVIPRENIKVTGSSRREVHAAGIKQAAGSTWESDCSTRANSCSTAVPY
jgi:hypothetical protein